MLDRAHWNGARWTAGEPRGHYESWFQRANHPTRPLAFWIRYTIFSPKGRPTDAIGELWAMYFDGEQNKIIAAKEERSVRECHFTKSELDARVGEATLNGAHLRGEASTAAHTLSWALSYESPHPPLLTFARKLYGAPIPKAKALVGSPNAVYRGQLKVDGEPIDIDGWVGSQNHNWGEKHTDEYAWGQVAGFAEEEDAFLEVACGRIKVGPVLTPAMTILTLRVRGEEFAFNTIGEGLKAYGKYDFFRFAFEAENDDVTIAGNIAAGVSDFVGLPYYNPPGGTKTCLNSKIARCDLTIRRRGQPPQMLSTRNRAAFEILTTDTDHGVPVLDPRA